METDVGELQATASRRKSQCKSGQGRRWQMRTEIKTFSTIQISFQE